MDKSSIKNKILSIGGGLIIFMIASYFVFNFIKTKDGAVLETSQDLSGIIKPEIVAYLQSINAKKEFLKDRDIIDSNFVRNLSPNSETINILYPKGRNNPFNP